MPDFKEAKSGTKGDNQATSPADIMTALFWMEENSRNLPSKKIMKKSVKKLKDQDEALTKIQQQIKKNEAIFNTTFRGLGVTDEKRLKALRRQAEKLQSLNGLSRKAAAAYESFVYSQADGKINEIERINDRTIALSQKRGIDPKNWWPLI